MKGYEIKIEEISISGYDYKIRALKDRQQFSDDQDIAGYQGISSANWSHFGVVWPCGIVLAQLISTLPLQGLRIRLPWYPNPASTSPAITVFWRQITAGVGWSRQPGEEKVPSLFPMLRSALQRSDMQQ